MDMDSVRDSVRILVRELAGDKTRVTVRDLVGDIKNLCNFLEKVARHFVCKISHLRGSGLCNVSHLSESG